MPPATRLGILSIPQRFKRPFRLRSHVEDRLKQCTGTFRTLRAGTNGLSDRALSHFAQLLAVVGLYPHRFASSAVDVLRFDGGIEQPRPFLSDFDAEGIVVVLRGNEGPALITVQSTVADHIILSAQRRASPTAAGDAGGAQKRYMNGAKAPSGKRGRRLGGGASLEKILIISPIAVLPGLKPAFLSRLHKPSEPACA